MKIADVQHNTDSGTMVIRVDHWPTDGFGVGGWVMIRETLYRIVAEHPKLKEIEVTRADPKSPEDAEPGEWSGP